jgi:hypothetical protein
MMFASLIGIFVIPTLYVTFQAVAREAAAIDAAARSRRAATADP